MPERCLHATKLGVVRRVWQERDLTSAKDLLTKLTLVERVYSSDATWKNFSSRGHEKLEELGVFVIDLPGFVLLERIDFFAPTPVNFLILAHDINLIGSLDLGFYKFDMLTNDGIVLLETKLVWRLSLVLHGCVEEAGPG